MEKLCNNIQNIMAISVGGGLMSEQNNDSINNVMGTFQSEAEFIQMIKDIEENKV
jgi:hypothetical protein